MALYRVAAEDRRVLDHYPGETFEADLDEIQEWRLIQAGAIERIWNVNDNAAGGAADTNQHEEQEQ